MPINEQMQDTIIAFGGEVKALDAGRVGGYLVTFGTADTPDLSEERDFFDATTDFGPHNRSITYYHHGLDGTLGLKVLDPAAEIGTDDVGVWIRAQLDLADAYQRAIYGAVMAQKMAWSSGSASHLVRRTPVETKSGKVHHVDTWPLGLDASITPTPADSRNKVLAIKSLPDAPAFEELCTVDPMKEIDIDAAIKSLLEGSRWRELPNTALALLGEYVRRAEAIKSLALQDAATKEGRILSQSRIDHVRSVHQQMGKAHAQMAAVHRALGDFVASCETDSGGGKSIDALRRMFLDTQARHHALVAGRD